MADEGAADGMGEDPDTVDSSSSVDEDMSSVCYNYVCKLASSSSTKADSTASRTTSASLAVNSAIQGQPLTSCPSKHTTTIIGEQKDIC
jgi:hypothetical protein